MVMGLEIIDQFQSFNSLIKIKIPIVQYKLIPMKLNPAYVQGLKDYYNFSWKFSITSTFLKYKCGGVE